MGKVMTVLGEIDSCELGFVDMHTHLNMKLPDGVNYDFMSGAIFNDTIVDNRTLNKIQQRQMMEDIYDLRKGYWVFVKDNFCLQDYELLKEEIQLYKNAGGKTIVEPSPCGMRGDVRIIKKLAEEVGINVLVSTGCYGDGLWPKEFVEKNEEELMNIMFDEIYNGIDGTDIKAGQVKVALNRFTELELKALRAGARVARDTGLCFSVHTGGTNLNPEYTLKMAQIIKEEGHNLEKTVFLHMDQTVTQHDLITYIKNHEQASKLILDPLRRLLDTGATLSFDCIGTHESKEMYDVVWSNDYERMAGLYKLLTEGYSKQLVVATDVWQKMYYRKFGGAGYCRVLDFVVPMLKKCGVGAGQIKDITCDNAARLLSIH